MHRKLHLHHHKHTGKLIHHRHTSYWALVLLVIISAIFAVCIERVAGAETIQVTATVPAPIPADPPIITSPAGGTTVTNGSITVAGTCPIITPAVIIAVYTSSTLLGSISCTASGDFSLPVSLLTGSNILTAQVVTITGQTGQTSSPVEVTYRTPQPETSLPSPSENNGSNPAPIKDTPREGSPNTVVIIPTSPFLTFKPGAPATFTLAFTGGRPPYTVTIEWGDDTKSARVVADHENYDFIHTYDTGDNYTLSVSVTDANGVTVKNYYAVVDLSPKTISIGAFIGSSMDTISNHLGDIPVLLYGVLLMAIVSLWHYEHSHYRRRVGIPIHYSWQRGHMQHKK